MRVTWRRERAALGLGGGGVRGGADAGTGMTRGPHSSAAQGAEAGGCGAGGPEDQLGRAVAGPRDWLRQAGCAAG
jgi:hypothetical protein